MSKLRLLVGAVLVLCLAVAVKADIAVKLLGDPAAMTGAKFDADPKSKKLYDRVDIMKKTPVAVTTPGGQVIRLTADAITIQSEEGWVDDISCRGPYEGVPIKTAIAYVDGFLTANKLTLPESDKKKWDEYKATPKDSFRTKIKLPQWTTIEVECSFRNDKGTTDIKIFASPEDTEGDPLPAGAVKLPITVSVFSPDGKWVTDGKTVIDLASMKEIAKVKYAEADSPRTEDDNKPVLSADGKLLAITGRGKILLVDTASWTVKPPIVVADLKPNAGLLVVGLSPAGDLVYVVSGGEVRAIATADGAEKLKFDKPPAEMEGCALSNDGNLLAVTRRHGHSIWLYNTKDGKIVKTLDPKPLPAGVNEYGLAQAEEAQFLPGDKTVVGSGWMGARPLVWSVDSGALTAAPKAMAAQMVPFSPDGKYFAVATWSTGWGANAVYLFDAKTEEVIGAARPLSGVFRGAAFSADGKFLIAWRHRGGDSLLFKTADLAKAKPGPMKAAAK